MFTFDGDGFVPKLNAETGKIASAFVYGRYIEIRPAFQRRVQQAANHHICQRRRNFAINAVWDYGM